MRVAVVGGTGAVGAPIVEELVRRGDDVRVLSRHAPAAPPLGASHHSIDLSTGAGLADALVGVEAVVDASNDSRKADQVLVEGSRRLAAAEADADVAHHVAISIVGCDRVPAAYYRSKVAQEEVVAHSPVPFSLLRATQFHTLLAAAFGFGERRRVVPTGKALLQPIAPAVVAERVAAAVHAGPSGRLPDVAGPQVQTLSELAATWRRHSDRRLVPVRLPSIGGLGKAVRAGALCNPDAAAAGPTFAEWLDAER